MTTKAKKPLRWFWDTRTVLDSDGSGCTLRDGMAHAEGCSYFNDPQWWRRAERLPRGVLSFLPAEVVCRRCAAREDRDGNERLAQWFAEARR